ncbi:MAG: hypothetical protein HZC28_13695 [Spirochaetes bacterium]|nr:hypothetical protein [Spirochaetota bacterium]
MAALRYKVGFLGIPGGQPIADKWTAENIERLKALGFNTIQLNVAWGSRPGDEPLNIEDIVELTPEQMRDYPQTVPLRSAPSPEKREQRRDNLRKRIALCRAAGMRTIFHFGAPYNAHQRYGDGPPNCISDDAVAKRYALLIENFTREFPGVDDMLLYTYDQDAWLCSEFGPCPRCLGIPLHERIVPFIERLADAWRKVSPEGRLWWEPWELSAGQVLACTERIDPAKIGLSLHSNIAEVQATFVADRWLKNTCQIAQERGIPVIVEHWLGAASEELEPLSHFTHPLVTLRALKEIAAIPGVSGIKEYYGLIPDRDDPNLRMTSLCFADSAVTEDEALRKAAAIYGDAADMMIDFWKLTSAGMELFPWDTSWYIREIGKCNPAHSTSMAMLRGQQAHTPSWESTRRAIFMKTDNAQPDPWMLEDVELRCRCAAERWTKALELGKKIRLNDRYAAHLQETLDDLAKIIRRTLSYVYHLRETNLAAILRRSPGGPYSAHVVEEMKRTLADDIESCRAEKECPELEAALKLLQEDTAAFEKTYFREAPDKCSKGGFSVTSR